MAGTKQRLKINGNAVWPQAALDNIVETAGSTVYVGLPKLDSQGKIETQYLPSYVDDIVDLIAIASAAPGTCVAGDRYYNSSSGNLKIYTATAANTWGTTGTTPEKDKIYVNTADSKIYRWSGSAMVEISKQVSTVTSIRAAASALDTVVPTEKAVATALGGKAASSHTHTMSNITNLETALNSKAAAADLTELQATVSSLSETVADKQDTLTAGTNISITNGTVSCTYSLPTAASNQLGGVKIGTNISISSGTISVANGSTSAKGVVQLATVAEATTGTIETKAVTPKGLKTELDKKANTSHTHSASDVTDLSTTISSAISGKVDSARVITDITGVTTSSAADGAERIPTAWAVRDYVDTELADKQDTLTAGTNISITNGTVSCTYSYTLPNATASAKGGIIAGAGLSMSGATCSVVTGSTAAAGILKVDETASNGAKLQVTSGTVKAVMVAGTTAAVGAVRLAKLAETTTGTAENLAVTPKGLKQELDKKANTSHTHSASDVTDLSTTISNAISGKVDSARVITDITGVTTSSAADGAERIPTAWAVIDYFKAGTNVSITSGTVSCTYSLPTAASGTLGGVKIGTNISISSGTISVANGSTSAKGVVQLATTAEATAGSIETKAVTPKGLKTALDGLIAIELV